MESIRVPVLIVGGGGCGLTASSILSNLGVDHVLVEKHAGTSLLPKAHVLNQRTAEILDQHGLWKSITDHSCPPEHMKRFLYSTSLGGDGPSDRVTLANPSAFGCDPDADNDDYRTYAQDSAYSATNLPLIRLEPILRREAETRNPGKVLFHHQVVSFKELEDHVLVEVLNRDTGTKLAYAADYIIAADGGKTFGPALGIDLEGPQHVADATSVHIKADLSEYWQDGNLMCWLVSLTDFESPLATPSGLFAGQWTVVVQMGPTWGKKSEEFVVHLGLGQNHLPLESLTNEDLKNCVRQSLRIPDLEMEILNTSRWHIQGVYATQYQTKRIFLAGDAVHRHPPTTGLGLNTAIGDAHNITWKLAAVLKGQASSAIFKTYQTERQPIGKHNTQWALFTFMNFRHLDTAVGLIPGPKELSPMNNALYQQLCADSFDGEARRAAVEYAGLGQRVECAAHDLEIGGVYSSGALSSDDTEPPAVDPRGQRYVSIARPGHRLPHVWLLGSKRVSTHHLLDDKGSWLLLTDDSANGRKWLTTAADIESQHGLKIKAVQIGGGGEFSDENGEWLKASGLEASSGGVVIIRPDGYVAFRSRYFSASTVSAIRTILGY